MDDSTARTAKKRLLEQEDGPSDHLTEHHGLDTAGGATRHPLPSSPDSRDSPTLSQGKLPPLQMRTSSASAESITFSPLLLPLPSALKESFPYQLNISRPRPLSLSENSQQQLKRQRLDSGTALPNVSSLGKYALTNDTETHQSRLRTSVAPLHEIRTLGCCPSDCEGQACTDARSLLNELANELLLLDARVRSALRKDSLPSPGEPKYRSVESSLQWALELPRRTNLNLHSNIKYPEFPSRGQSPPRPHAWASMKRGQPPLEREDAASPTPRSHGTSRGYATHSHASTLSDDRRRNPFSSDIPPTTDSPFRTASSSASAFLPQQSPMPAPPSSRVGKLPSPSSLNFPIVGSLPPMSPASTTLQTPAQAAHVQELQHHVSVKTLAFQTLQREYDDLSQELERQRTKYAALEMKFEASDVDINYLTDEKERLHAQVASLESQVEGLQESREEARRQQVANGAQYMRIVEMANRLQAQGSEDKRRWDTERSELEQRIRILEEAMVTGHAVGTGLPAGADTTTHSSSPPCSRPENFNPHLAPFAVSAASSETVNVLRTEIGRLRKRTQGLEEALQGVKQESVEVQAAAKQLLESGLRMEKGVQDTLGG